MNQRELERVEKDSIYTLRLTNDLKDQVINEYLNNLVKVLKKEIKKKKNIITLILEDQI